MEVEMKKATETEIETKEETETKEVKTESPKGFYVGEVITGRQNVIAFNGETVNELELLVKVANAVKDNGLLK